MDNNYCVYKHTAPNGKIYIGITSQCPEYRWGRDGSGYTKNRHFYNAIKKYGWDQIKHEIILDKLSRSQACGYEEMLILFYRSNEREFGYNHTSGGECGYVLNDDIKKALSNKTKQLWNNAEWSDNQRRIRLTKDFREGQRLKAKAQWQNLEIKEKMIKAIREKYNEQDYKEKIKIIARNPERRKKISEGSKKHWKNQEYREKMKRVAKSLWDGEQGEKQRQLVRLSNEKRWGDSEYRKNHTGANSKQSKAIFKYDLSGKYIKKYECVNDAARELNVNSGHISACANGHRKTAYGYIWKYA